MSEGKSAATPQPERRIGDRRSGVPQILAGPNAVTNPQFRRSGMDRRVGSVAAPKAQPEVQGLWPADCLQRAFVEGAAWWQYQENGATMFSLERQQAEAEAVSRYGAPKAGEPPQELSTWLDTTLWSFVHGALLDLGVCTGRESTTEAHDSLHKHMRGAVLAALQVGAGETPAERWIPVAERTPDDKEIVWVWNCASKLGESSQYVAGRFIDESGIELDISEVVTHWRPLPLPPGAGSTKEGK